MKTNILKILMFAFVLPSCLNENDEGGLLDDTTVISYQSLSIPQDASQSYVLSVPEWETDQDGNSFYLHAGDDDYAGLRATSNNADPVQDLKFQLSKDIPSFSSFLQLDGVFLASQSLRVNLPFTMFNDNGLLLNTTSAGTVNVANFDFFFQAANSDSELSVEVSAVEDGNSVEIEVSEIGTIIVRRKCSDSECVTNAQAFALSVPQLEFKHYHNLNPALRTFTWPIGLGTAQCSTNGGGSFESCTSATSLELTPSEFNSDSLVVVRVTDTQNKTEDATLDLSDTSLGFHDVTFHSCDVILSGAIETTVVEAEVSNGKVICFEPGTAVSSAVSNGALSLIAENLVIIGDHDDRTTIVNNDLTNDATDFCSAIKVGDPSMANPPSTTLANLDITYNGPGINCSGIKVDQFTNTTIWPNTEVSYNVFSNISVHRNHSASRNALRIPPGHHTTILDSSFSTVQNVAHPLIRVDDSILIMHRTEVLNHGDQAILFASPANSETLGGLYSEIHHSKISNIDSTCSTRSTMKIQKITTPSETHRLRMYDSYIISSDDGLDISQYVTVDLQRNIFEQDDECSGNKVGINSIVSTTNTFVNGSDNIYCTNNASFPYSIGIFAGFSPAPPAEFDDPLVSGTCPIWSF